MTKGKWFLINIEKEEKWINQWIHRGYRLKNVRTGIRQYVFEEALQDEKEGEHSLYEVKMDFRTFEKEADFQDYLALFEDSGWRHVAGTKSGGVQYFERMNDSATEDIFSDTCSKAERYKRMANMWLSLAVLFLPALIVFWQKGLLDIGRLFHMKELYYTPGLWEMTGRQFLMAFLFETPFALGRCMTGLPFLILLIGYAFCGCKALYWSRKEKKRTNL